MHAGQLDAPLGHHVTGYGGIDAPRDQQGRPSAGAHRHAARAGQLRRVNIGAEIADFHHHHHVGLMDVHPQMGISLQQTAAHVGADIGGFQRKLLVSTLKVRACVSAGFR